MRTKNWSICSTSANTSRSKNYSVPKDDPIHNARTDAQLRAAIRNQMIPCHVVLIMAGVYSTYSKWIGIEIEIAQRGFLTPKPIIAIKPWGNDRKEQPTKVIWMRSGWSSGSICWVLLASGRFAVSKTIIPEAQEHFLTPSAHRDTHIFGGLGLILRLEAI